MKEITILSGKGGTGKTTLTAAMGSIAGDAVFCDSDVDAADLHLIFHPDIQEEHRFYGGWNTVIDGDKCSGCQICMSYCRFDAIEDTGSGIPKIDPFKCEGCRLCERICPEQAIHSVRSDNNFWYVSSTRFGTLVHARMGAGEENSGKLVTQVRNRAREIANEKHNPYLINDGPPGIGCAAIASLTGTDMILLVTEPTYTGFHDLKRLVALIESFGIQAFAIINKHDINPGIAKNIENYLKDHTIPVLAHIPFDKAMVEAMTAGKTIVEYHPGSAISKIIKEIWDKILAQGNNRENFHKQHVSN